MNVTKESIENYQVVLTVEVEAEELTKAEKKACKSLADRVSIPGFRKGKAPRAVLEQRIGKKAILDEAFDIMCPSALEKAFEQENIAPVTRPNVDVVTLESGKDVTFKVTVTPRPEVTLGEYKGLKIEKKPVEVKEEDVEHQILHMREHQGTMVDVPEDALVEDRDFVTLDFKGYVDGEPFEGGEGRDYPLQIGSKSFIPGFEDQLIGMKVEEEKEIHVTFPEDYHEESLSGKDATFKCTVHSIKRKELPPEDDELAKKASKFDTLEELKEDIRKNLRDNAERRAENERASEALEKAAENITADIPPVMVDNRVTTMIQELSMRLEQQGMNIGQYMQYAGTDMDKLREEYRETAEKNVRMDLMLEEVAKVEDIKAESEDLVREIAEMAVAYGVKPKDVQKIIREQNRVSDLAATVIRKKTAKFIVDNITE